MNTACIRKLPETDYVQILVNQEKKKLAVRPCSEDSKDSFRWCSATAKRTPKHVTCRVFYGKIIELMNGILITDISWLESSFNPTDNSIYF